MMALLHQSTPSPLRGGIKGGGREPGYCGSQHPLLASPVKGEVPRGDCGEMEPNYAG
jgi:hypothetical protein